MTTVEMQQLVAVHNALIDAMHAAHVKPLPDTEAKIIDYLTSLGVTATVDPDGGFLRLMQGTTEIAVSPACQQIKAKHPEWFVSTPGQGQITSKEDFRGSPREIQVAKSAYIQKHGLDAWQNLPNTGAEAQRKAIIPSPLMNRKEYLQLTFSERARLASLGPDVISKIMARTQ